MQIFNMQLTTGRRLGEVESGAPRRLAVPLSSTSAGYNSVGGFSPLEFAADPQTGITFEDAPIIFPGGVLTIPSDTPPMGPGMIAGLSVAGLAPFVFLLWLLQRMQKKKLQQQMKALRKELEDFKDSVVGMRWVPEDWDSRAPDGGSGVDWHYLCHELGIDESKGKDAVAKESAQVLGFDADGLSCDEILLKANRELNGEVGGGSVQEPVETAKEENNSWLGNLGSPWTSPKEESGPPMTQHRWYWQEDAGNLSKHNPADVKDGYVAFAGSVCRELDEKFHKFTHEGGPQSVLLDLNDRVGSTGTEAKAHNAHTGVRC